MGVLKVKNFMETEIIIDRISICMKKETNIKINTFIRFFFLNIYLRNDSRDLFGTIARGTFPGARNLTQEKR